MKIWDWSKLYFAIGAVAWAAPAMAQRTDANAVDNADDAFGRTVGDERIGMYNAGLVRGFSPEAAGNVRIEGLYFDQRAFITQRLVDGVAIRVGIAAQGYPFSAPTGIADYSLRKPGSEFVGALAVNYGPFGGYNAEADLKIPLAGERLGMTAGVAFYQDETAWGTSPEYDTYGLSVRFQPSEAFSIQPFWGRIDYRDEIPRALIFTSGAFLPESFERTARIGQEWAGNRGQRNMYGVVSKAELGGFQIDAGLFKSLDLRDRTYADLWFDTDRAGLAGERVIVVDENNRQVSLSGELRLSKSLRSGAARHRFFATLRARDVDRKFGGSAVASIGQAQLGVPSPVPEPALVFGPKSLDAVQQVNLGLGYELRWPGVGELSLGLQRADYRKEIRLPGAPVATSNADPWLLNAAAAVSLTPSLVAYASFARGLEESDIAPVNAINRFEAPPAILTEQVDGGIRWLVNPGVSAVAGVFSVTKPYFNLDVDARFRELGVIRNRGVELSLTGQIAPGLRIVGGTIFLDQRISGDPVERGIIGERPVGSFRLHTIINASWQLPWHAPLTLTGRVERATSRPADLLDTYRIPARVLIGLGARYRTSINGTPVLARLTIDNVTGNFGWAAGGSGFLFHNAPRRYSLSLAMDV